METEKNYGLLLNDNLQLHRCYFEEMVRLRGIQVLYRAPKEDKHWTTYAEIESNYERPVIVGCIFEEHPQQKTMKKLGWLSELDENASLIEVPYDLYRLQAGALFIIPSGLDNSVGRLFKVVEMSNSMIYPSSITCKIVPEYEDTCEPSQLAHLNDSASMIKRVDDVI